MKKTLIAVLSVMIVMLFAVSSFALHAVPEMFEYTPQIVKSKKAQIELGGHIRVRGRASDNTSDFKDTESGSNDDSKEYWDQRLRLGLKMTVSPNTMGAIELENGGNSDSDTSDSYTHGNSGFGSNSNQYAQGNSKRGSMRIRQAYIAHQTKALGPLAGFKIGHMLTGLGNGIFYNHTQYGDDGVVLWMSPADGMEIALNAMKLNEGTTAVSDDVTAYAFVFNGAFGPAKVGADISYLNDNSTAGTPFDLYNLGLRADFAAGPAKIKADLEIQTGGIENGAPSGGDLDFGGYAAMVQAAIAAGPVTIDAGFGYGSGDDSATDDDFDGFITSLSDGQKFTYLYDQFTATAAQNPATQAWMNTNDTGLSNTTYVNVGVNAKPTSDIGVSADLFWLAASEEVSSTSGLDDTDIGVELDGKFTYQLDTNLVYYIEGGILFAGDFWKNKSAVGSTGSPDDPWSLRHGVVLKF